METVVDKRHRFLVCFSSGSYAVYSNITFTGRETVPPGVCVCVHACSTACVYVCVHTIEYTQCTQPAQREDPFSHQIFTNNHRLPAACCYNAHTLQCYGCLMYSLEKVPHKMFEQSILRIFFFLQVYAAQLQV